MAGVAEKQRRIDVLSKAKSIPDGFIEDRRSVYWVDRRPPEPQGRSDGGGSQITLFATTTRLEELAKNRSVHPSFNFHRPIPSSVRKSALEAVASERLASLSRHKSTHSEFEMERSPYSVVTPAAAGAASSVRVEALAKPIVRENRFGVHETEWGQANPVSTMAMRATTAPHIESLSEPKEYHQEFKGEKPIQWPVSDQALKAIASLRIQQLARPRSRTMIKDDYDPYRVTVAAKKARATPRLDELCAPILRKVRQKKLFA